MNKEITVVKFGSEIVCGQDGIDQDLINGYVNGLVETYDPHGLVVVTSGAVKAGEKRLAAIGDTAEGYDNVTLAQLGSAVVMRAWETAFEEHDILAGGLLTTHNEIHSSNEGPKLVETMHSALDRGVVSIVNENDALSDEELRTYAWGGDNDGLASLIAKKIGASSLLLLTEMGGVYDDEGKLVEEVNRTNINELHQMLVFRAIQDGITESSGRGGMISKFDAAWAAAATRAIDSSIAAPNDDMTGVNKTRFVVG